MGWLLFYLFLAIGVSFLCSILEAVILSVTPGFAGALEQESPEAGAALRLLKANINRPLAAILSLNTVAHTVGAAGVGAQALVVFGDAYVAVASAILTLLILVISEIIPKTLGAYYWKHLVRFTVRVLPPMILLLYPLVLMSQKIAGWLASEEYMSMISREELRAMTELARKEGVVGEQESRILKNLLLVRGLTARDIMTPRPVMFTLPAEMAVQDVVSRHPELAFSRIPIFEEDPEDIHSVVLKDELLAAARSEDDVKLLSLARPMQIVPDVISFYKLFELFLDQRLHIALLVNEYGAITGLVTLEDVVETLLGIEIVDESDAETDMQAVARQRWARRARAQGLDLNVIEDADSGE